MWGDVGRWPDRGEERFDLERDEEDDNGEGDVGKAVDHLPRVAREV